MIARHKLPRMPLPDADTSPATVLALDCSTERLAIGLATPEGSWLHEGEGGAAASAQLLPRVHELLARAGIGFAALEAIAFGRGPGAFTGLRTACAVAQGLGFALGRPLVPVDSLLVVAEDARRQLGEDTAPAGRVFAVAMDARMDEAYAGIWRHAPDGWLALEAPALLGLPALQSAWARHAGAIDVLCGSALSAFGGRVAWPVADARPAEAGRAQALLGLACAAWARREAVDAAAALPLYLRDKVALTTAERAARAAT